MCLPPGRELLADLSAPTYSVTPSGIQVEAKEKVCERLKRSTNHGDAVIMAWFYGAKEINSALEWATNSHRSAKRGQEPRNILSRQPRTGRRR